MKCVPGYPPQQPTLVPRLILSIFLDSTCIRARRPLLGGFEVGPTYVARSVQYARGSKLATTIITSREICVTNNYVHVESTHMYLYILGI